MALIDATYLGEASANLAWDTAFKVVGQSNRAYATSDPGCGVLPRGVLDAPEAFTGGRVTANVCWSVPETDIASLVMFASPCGGVASGSFWRSPQRVPCGMARLTRRSRCPPPVARSPLRGRRRVETGAQGGRHNPIPFGQTATVGD